MSIFPEYIEMLMREHARQPITGDVLLIGRQRIEYSKMTDKELFGQFPGTRFHALDASDFEGADVIHDLNKPLPSRFFGVCDFIFDGSCLDNIWDPAQAIRSLSKMLRPGGRMMLVEHGTAIQGCVVVFSPEWFFDFFAANDYEDCKITLFQFPPGGLYAGRWKEIQWEPYGVDGSPVTATPATEIGDFMNVVIARKGSASTDDRTAVQAQYRLMHGASDEIYRAAAGRWAR